MRALVIDDARVMRLLLRGTMEKLGFEVSEAGDGDEGLAKLLEGGRPDVVLVDCYMPRMDGLEFLRRVRADAALAGLRVILVTGETDEAFARRAVEQGADACVTKPFTREALGQRLAELGVR